jgi:hypothetical protein
VHLLSYAVKRTVTDSPFNNQANCSKCPLSAWMHFLTGVTRELVTLRSTALLRRVTSSLVCTAVLRKITSPLVTPDRKCIQAHRGQFEQFA